MAYHICLDLCGAAIRRRVIISTLFIKMPMICCIWSFYCIEHSFKWRTRSISPNTSDARLGPEYFTSTFLYATMLHICVVRMKKVLISIKTLKKPFRNLVILTEKLHKAAVSLSRHKQSKVPGIYTEPWKLQLPFLRWARYFNRYTILNSKFFLLTYLHSSTEML